MDFRERLRRGNVGMGRFGRLSGKMRMVSDHSDLESLRAAGRGFIINIRHDKSTIHRVTCETVEVMSTSAYLKVFSETAHQTVDWVNTDFDKVPWEHCGVCGGARE